MYKDTIFERYTQRKPPCRWTFQSCYDVQRYNFWKIYTTSIFNYAQDFQLLWCTKIQFLKDIHNQISDWFRYLVVVMMYKDTIFERYTQQHLLRSRCVGSCYDVQRYNFWKIYTTPNTFAPLTNLLLWCTKIQFLKDIHNPRRPRHK